MVAGTSTGNREIAREKMGVMEVREPQLEKVTKRSDGKQMGSTPAAWKP